MTYEFSLCLPLVEWDIKTWDFGISIYVSLTRREYSQQISLSGCIFIETQALISKLIILEEIFSS